MGGIFLLKLNIERRPIENKYREGKLKRAPHGVSKYLKLDSGWNGALGLIIRVAGLFFALCI